MDKLRSLLPYFLLLAVSAAIVVFLFPHAHEYGGLRVRSDDTEVRDLSRSLLGNMKIDIAGAEAQVQFFEDRSLIKRLQQDRGLRETNQVLRDSLLGYFWRIRWTREKELSLSLGNDADEKELQHLERILRGDITTAFDMHGRLHSFERSVADSVKLPSVNVDSARTLVLAFLRTYTEFRDFPDTTRPSTTKTTEQPQRTDHQFTWLLHSPSHGEIVTVRTAVAGTFVSSYEIESPKPEDDLWDNVHRILATISIFVFVAIGIVMIVMTIRRLRSFEIGFRMAMIMGITALLFNVELYLSISHQLTWELMIPLLITPIFTGGGMVLLWAVAESTIREVWKEKIIPFDLITHGHLLHSRIGESTIRGIGIGTAALALNLVLIFAADSLMPLSVKYGQTDGIRLFTVTLPGLYALGHGFFTTAFPFAFFGIFFLSFLRKYLRSGIIVVAICAIAMSMTMLGDISPTPVMFIVQAICSALVLWSFYRYDALTSLFGFVTWSTLQQAGMLFVSGHQKYILSAEFVILSFVLFIAASIFTFFRSKEIAEFEAIVPAFSRYISDRQRMQQELEIARSVQMSFLPKQNPVRATLDIASRCAPALEVGGDYYDFIELPDDKLGVAIGDVSGKGTQAAFFMTLTKGFLRAVANISESPSSILTQVNKLFYESVERGMFISMVYGVFDTAKRTLTLARAGHNPVIMRKGQANNVQSVNPMGLALGLDAGETFAKSIQEVSISFLPGDLFVFYTDGFPEAMNKKKDEFGEDRLAQAVEKFAGGSASEIMDGIFKEVNTFSGNAPQHDDMTIVVVKIRD